MAHDELIARLGGMRIVINDNLPREHVGHYIHEVRAHPFVAWLLRLFGKSDFVGWGATKMFEAKALMMGGTMFVTSQQYAALRAASDQEK